MPARSEPPLDSAGAAALNPPLRSTALFAGVEPLEVFVDLLSEIDATTTSEFYARICEAVCRLTTMRRAAIFLYDVGRRRVSVAGSHGVSFARLQRMRPTLADAPLAQRALTANEVVVASENIEREVPVEFAEVFGITTVVCTPLSAAGRGYGVICSDRGGGRFDLTDGERHLLWTLGKTAALATTARFATGQQYRARRMSERLELAREVHERVVQRLFGVSLVLSAEKPLSDEERDRCRGEMDEALADLRGVLERPFGSRIQAPGRTTTLRGELDRIAREAPELPLHVRWPDGFEIPRALEPLVQSVLAEALRNIDRHADPASVDIAVERDRDTLTLEVRNDGVRRGARGTGMGLRLAAFDALEHGGLVDFGPVDDGEAPAWRVRLVAPLAH